MPTFIRHGPISQFMSLSESLEATNMMLEDLAAVETPDTPMTNVTTAEGSSEIVIVRTRLD